MSPASASSGLSGSSSVFSGVSIAEEVDGERENLSGDNTMIDLETLFEAVLNVSLRFASFINEHLSGKKQDFHSWDYCYQVLDNEDFQIIRRQIKGILQYVWDSFQMVSFCRLVEYDGCSCRQCYVKICLGMILTKLPILRAESQSKYAISDFCSCKDSYCCLLGYDTIYLARLGPMEHFISSQQCCSRLCYTVLNGK